jgi:hypothetical protein
MRVQEGPTRPNGVRAMVSSRSPAASKASIVIGVSVSTRGEHLDANVVLAEFARRAAPKHQHGRLRGAVGG